jgi:ribosomal protein S18 acetylase RimI-like enzyme
MEQIIMIRMMVAADVDVVTSIYAEVLDPSYISFSELAEGKAEAFGQLSEQAALIFRAQLISLLSSPHHGFFVATLADDIVGFALASLHRAGAGHIECWLDDIGVSHKSQRRGIAQALVERVFDWGTKGNAKYFLLESGVENEAAHCLFERLGFRPLSTVFWRAGGGIGHEVFASVHP